MENVIVVILMLLYAVYSGHKKKKKALEKAKQKQATSFNEAVENTTPFDLHKKSRLEGSHDEKMPAVALSSENRADTLLDRIFGLEQGKELETSHASCQSFAHIDSIENTSPVGSSLERELSERNREMRRGFGSDMDALKEKIAAFNTDDNAQRIQYQGDDLFSTEKRFDLRQAVIYSEILNRKYT